MLNKYLDFYKKCSIDDMSFLLEAGQGKNINGNIYAILNELMTNHEWENYKVYLVVCEDTIIAAKERVNFYNYKDVNLVIRNSNEYKKLLATCKYLITDNSFPPYYIKKDSQVVLNTWHGTPWKRLGRSDIANSSSISNVQKNFAMSNYILFPNKYTRDIFMDDYSLKNIISNKIVLSDYPRNVAFYNEELKKTIIDKYNLKDKKVYAYMPTWRGSSRNANIYTQKRIIHQLLKEIDNCLQNDQTLFINLHFLIGNNIDLSCFKHIKMFPKEYETYDFLNVCDVLITDYSSVFFDFAVTGRKIILFTYDLEEYMNERGMYFSIDDLPFPKVNNVAELINELNNSNNDHYKDFCNKYCEYSSPSVVRDLLELLVKGKSSKVILEDVPRNNKKNVFIHVNKVINNHQKQFVLDYFNNLDKKNNYILLFNGKLNNEYIELIQMLPDNIQIYGYVAKNEFSFMEKQVLRVCSRFKMLNKIFGKLVNNSLKREYKRKFLDLEIDEFVNLLDSSRFVIQEISFKNCKKTNIEIPMEYLGLKNNCKWFLNRNNEFLLSCDKKEIYQKKIYDNEIKETFYNQCVSFCRLFDRLHYSNNSLSYKMCFAYKTNIDFNFDSVNVYIDDMIVESNFKFEKGLHLFNDLYLNFLTINISQEAILSRAIQNKVQFSYENGLGLGFKKNIKYSLLRGNNDFHNSKIIKINETICCYFRQSKGNFLFLTVREHNYTDKKIENFKINLAFYLSKLFKNKQLYLLFEKDSARYEESASVVYESLIDEGYKNAYFILDKNYRDIGCIENKYKKNIIYKYSFKHYLYFFICNTFLGSEALIHALELRANNIHVLKKVNSKSVNYVFLQHGVMYMISLDSESRKFFKPKSVKEEGKFRVVTSSLVEANHFIELGGYDSSQVVVCGLPKFDRNIWNKYANKIVIMPTWRPWEYNEALTDFKSCNYYKMLLRIFNHIPNEYRDNVIILAHPLFYNAASNNEFDLKKYMLFDVKYDEILRDAKVLITDYSSIAYDAFYRGTNVMFYWEELQECLDHYGPSTKLMLNENNVFGDICRNPNDISHYLIDNYTKDQKEIYKERYKRIVEFHDNQNTARLIDFLRKDGIIR